MPFDKSEPAAPYFAIHDRELGDVTFRRVNSAHRVRLYTHSDLARSVPAWTLFITGPRVREWGFWCRQGRRHWRVFTDPDDSGKIGLGCD